MKIQQERALQTFQRVSAFLADHPPNPAPPNYAQQIATLDEVVRHLTQLAIDQDASVRLSEQETRRQNAIRVKLREEQMRPIAHIASTLLKTSPGIERALRIPGPRVRNKALIAAAGAMAEAVTPYSKVFIDNGEPATFIEDLRATAKALDDSLTGRVGLRGRRSSATVAVPTGISAGRRVVRLLDTVVRRAYRGNDHLLAEWTDAKKTQRASGTSLLGISGLTTVGRIGSSWSPAPTTQPPTPPALPAVVGAVPAVSPAVQPPPHAGM